MRDEEMIGFDIFFQFKGHKVSGRVIEAFGDYITVDIYETGDIITMRNPYRKVEKD